jgi:hypothetical protein
LLPPALRSLVAPAAIPSDFFSAAVRCAFGLQLPFCPRFVPGIGSYPGQQREVCFAGAFLARPCRVELWFEERLEQECLEEADAARRVAMQK